VAIVEHHSSPYERSSELTASFSDTAQALFSAASPADTLLAVVDLAVGTIEGCDFASIFVLDGDALTTPVGTDSVAADVDVAQHRAGEGPGFDAISEGRAVYTQDVADDPRWVSFGPDAAKAGVRSALTLRLSDDDSRRAALSLYAGYPGRLGR
jgi:GAF domain-containing protein